MPIAVSLASTPACLLLALASGGAGHGDYLWAKLLFPLTMLSTSVFGSITVPFIVLAVAQYPAYGVVLGLANAKSRLATTLRTVILAHTLLAGLCLVALDANF
jgi:hypothetical protein